jgi:hypothetical protein
MYGRSHSFAESGMFQERTSTRELLDHSHEDVCNVGVR